MRFNEFNDLTIRIDEVSMAPGKISKIAEGINAICGIEFELYVPTSIASEETTDYDMEIYSIDDIDEFFKNNGDNSSYNIRRLVNKLKQDYNEYTEEQHESDWVDTMESNIRDYIEENDWDEDDAYNDAYSELNLSDEEIEAVEASRASNQKNDELLNQVKEIVSSKLQDKVDTAIHLKHKDRNYLEAFSEFIDDYEFPSDWDFLQSNNLTTTRAVYEKYSRYIDWPEENENGSTTLLADVIQSEFGYPTVGCDDYHGCEEYKGEYFVVEKDSSLNSQIVDYVGVEIVSPALPLSEMIAVLRNFVKWANSVDCITDKTCGLHMNLSIENVDMENVDFVKLALFTGDNYIAKEFHRLGHKYCKNTIDQIKHTVTNDPSKGYAAIDALQQSLSSIAGNLIQTSAQFGNSSINMQDNRVEFRSPGDNWLDEDIDKLVNTVNRFAVALNIASNPDLYKEEYAKKLYKLLYSKNIDEYILKQFTNHQAGSISDEELISLMTMNVADKTSNYSPDKEQEYQKFIQKLTSQLQSGKISYDQYIQAINMKYPQANTPKADQTPTSDRSSDKIPTKSWIITWPNGEQMTYVGDTQVAALNNMRQSLKLNSVRYPNDMFTVEPSPQTDIFQTFK